ncbi:homeobox domain-containing protein 3 [Vairimorpha necatrix]|uniref:Homeobox domain-containing protein 3 n=1 Tax=Vairimorpha necatrix TaxID=6039 RepID=A0AAX4JFW0_9MICR
MEPYGRNYYKNFEIQSQNENINQYYDPFYVKHRKRTTKAQLKVLEKTFEVCPRPDSCMRKKLGDQLSMTPRCVQVWFQNRRAKHKKQQQASEYCKNTTNYQMGGKPYYYDENFEIYAMDMANNQHYQHLYENMPNGPYMENENVINNHYIEEENVPVYEHLYDRNMFSYE